MNIKEIIETKVKTFTYKFKLNIDVEKFIDKLMSDIPKSTIEYTATLNSYIAEKANNESFTNPEFSKLATALVVSNIHDNKINFVEATKKLQKYGLLNDDYCSFVYKHEKRILETIDDEKDYNFTYFGIQCLNKSYLLGYYDDVDQYDDRFEAGKTEAGDNPLVKKENDKEVKLLNENDKQKDDDKLPNEKKITFEQVETPQMLWMRVSIGMYYKTDDIENALECYSYLSDMLFIQASPTLYNTGNKHEQLASCFLLNMEDTIDGIFKTQADSGRINKWAGGVGFSVSKMRASGSIIRGTNGKSSGLIPLANTLNASVRMINQGGKRNGAIAFYLEPWHSDVFEFCDLKRQDGDVETRARDLFYGLWINDLFMERVRDGKMWSLMCPKKCPGLVESYGDEFKKLYEKYESQGRYIRRIRAKELWEKIIATQQMTGTPYMLFKDHCNKKSNQKNIGTIQGSNLCTEIIQYSDENNYAVCNLASICLPKFVRIDEKGNATFDYESLEYISGFITQNINNVIDITFYPVPEARKSNMETRPIGIGVQGLADVFCMFDISFDSNEAKILNKKIFETIYYGSLKKSVEIAKKDGPYKCFKDSPFSEGKLQFHMWGLTVDDLLTKDMFDWNKLIADVKKHGTRNSLLTTCMPTASTSHIMGNNECIEPYIRNLFVKSTIDGNYTIVNKHLVNRLIQLDSWNDDVRNALRVNDGSIQNIKGVPKQVKEVYKTAYEIGAKTLLQLSIDRAPFIDQSQSLNLFFDKLSTKGLSDAHFFSWNNGLKTGMYYLRTKPPVDPLLFSVDYSTVKKLKKKTKTIECESCQ
jgi:ribonucleoside-diphosphate reductase alpha subunit